MVGTGASDLWQTLPCRFPTLPLNEALCWLPLWLLGLLGNWAAHRAFQVPPTTV